MVCHAHIFTHLTVNILYPPATARALLQWKYLLNGWIFLIQIGQGDGVHLYHLDMRLAATVDYELYGPEIRNRKALTLGVVSETSSQGEALTCGSAERVTLAQPGLNGAVGTRAPRGGFGIISDTGTAETRRFQLGDRGMLRNKRDMILTLGDMSYRISTPGATSSGTKTEDIHYTYVTTMGSTIFTQTCPKIGILSSTARAQTGGSGTEVSCRWISREWYTRGDPQPGPLMHSAATRMEGLPSEPVLAIRLFRLFL